MMFCKTGMRNARVFPVPVRAWARLYISSVFEKDWWKRIESAYTSMPFSVSLIVRLCTCVMVSKRISCVKVLMTVGDTIPLSASSWNLVTGPCFVAALICESDGAPCQFIPSSTSPSTRSSSACDSAVAVDDLRHNGEECRDLAMSLGWIGRRSPHVAQDETTLLEEEGAAKANRDRPRDVLPLRNAVNMDYEECLIRGALVGN